MRSRSQPRNNPSNRQNKVSLGNTLTLSSPVVTAGKGTRLPMIASSPTGGSGLSSSLFGNLFDELSPAPSTATAANTVTTMSSPSASTSPHWTSTSRQPGFLVGVCSQQGRRPYQEDEYCIRPFLNKSANDPETHFFGLFDGHAGGRCSNHLATTLAMALADDELFTSNLPSALKRSYHTVNDAFLKVAEKQKLHDGSTGLCCVLRDNKLVVANVGDCRALLISASNLQVTQSNGLPSSSSTSLSVHCVQLTTDHKPSLMEEQRRIAQLGGCVVNCMGVPRVNRVLAVSRAFGNRTLRSVIRPDADIIQKDINNEDFLVVASDGLWDVLRNREVAEIAYSPALQRKPQAIADELVSLAIAKGSQDNVTCIVVGLSDYKTKSASSSNLGATGSFQEDARYFKKQLESALTSSHLNGIAMQSGAAPSNNNQMANDGAVARQYSLNRLDKEVEGPSTGLNSGSGKSFGLPQRNSLQRASSSDSFLESTIAAAGFRPNTAVEAFADRGDSAAALNIAVKPSNRDRLVLNGLGGSSVQSAASPRLAPLPGLDHSTQRSDSPGVAMNSPSLSAPRSGSRFGPRLLPSPTVDHSPQNSHWLSSSKDSKMDE